MREIKDPGLGSQYSNQPGRFITKEGRFNIHKKGGVSGIWDLYRFLIDLNWVAFVGLTFLGFLALNFGFALLYLWVGLEGLDFGGREVGFWQALYFSIQTFSTVGYGAISPVSNAANILASLEALIGFFTFAIGTGLLYGRFAKPKPRLAYSKNILITPYKDTEYKSVQFKLANKRNNVIIDVAAEVILTYNEAKGTETVQHFFRLPLERTRISLLPLTWTIVHIIDADSPFFGLDDDAILALKPEFLVLIRAYDETYNQDIHDLFSYGPDEMKYNLAFEKNFDAQPDGQIVVDLTAMDRYKEV